MCTQSALTAYEYRIFIRNSQRLWLKAINSLNQISSSEATSSRSLCAFVDPEKLTIQTVADYSGSDAKTILNRFKNKIGKKRKIRTPRGGPTCVCPDCKKSFPSPYLLNLHLVNSGQKAACQHCGVVLHTGQAMKDHMTKVHGEKVFLCKDCPQLFTNELDFLSHTKKAHRPGALTCSHCGRTFPRDKSFDVHAQMHAVRTCRACGNQFTNRACYREHRSKCEPDAKPDAQSLPRNLRSNLRDPAQFTCDHCGKTYSSRPQLKNHILWIHMDVRPHQCQWCGKRFYTPSRLAEHTVVHTRERNFECDICGMKLVSKMAAVYHRRRHTGEKPYACEDCGEKFISASRRSEHAKRKHGKGLRIQCLQCPANFVKAFDHRKHMEKAHSAQNDTFKMIKVKG